MELTLKHLPSGQQERNWIYSQTQSIHHHLKGTTWRWKPLKRWVVGARSLSVIISMPSFISHEMLASSLFSICWHDFLTHQNCEALQETGGDGTVALAASSQPYQLARMQSNIVMERWGRMGNWTLPWQLLISWNLSGSDTRYEARQWQSKLEWNWRPARTPYPG